jgi:integrase
MIARKPVVAVYVRHSSTCPQYGKSELFRGCDCPKWLRYSHAGKQRREAAGTRSWGQAEGLREQLQKRLDGTGDGTDDPGTGTQIGGTIAKALENHLLSKAKMTPMVIRRHKVQLGKFVDFLSGRGKELVSEITDTDVLQWRESWPWTSGLTQQKAQTNLRSFLVASGRADLLLKLKPIKLSREDVKRLKPQPFTEEELKHLIAQIAVSFPDPVKAARLVTLTHLMVSTGLAIRDAGQLEKGNIVDGWLRIERQKTNKAVNQKLDPALLKELERVRNGNPRYIFWNGALAKDSISNVWLRDIRILMKAAGLYIKGNLSHRFRDTAVDYWLGEGCDMTTIAVMLGDTVAVAERHYGDFASQRMQERLARVPTRTW